MTVAEKMKDDDELEMLLGEIPHATSSSDVHHHQRNSVSDSGYGPYGHAPYLNGHSHPHGHVYGESHAHSHGGMCNDELLKHAYACSSSRLSSQFDGGSSSSLFASGYKIGSPAVTPAQFQEVRRFTPGPGSRFCSYFENDDLNLLRNFGRMYINEEPECARDFSNGAQSCNRSPNRGSRMILENCSPFDNYRKGFSRNEQLLNPPVPTETVPPLTEIQLDPRMTNLSRSMHQPSQLDGMYDLSDFSNSVLNPHVYGATFPMGYMVSSPVNRPSVGGDSYLYPSRNGMNLIEAGDSFYPPNVVQLKCLMPQYSEEYMPNGRNKDSPHGKEDSLIIQGDSVNYVTNQRTRGHNIRPQEKRSHLDDHIKVASSFSMSKCSSLREAQGYMYHMAKDQHGCRFLQRIFDDGTPQEMQIIFNEIIDHVVELMMNPFGNYLMQKLLEKCDEQQRMHVLLRVTQEPGELVRISLNPHGTRVVQKLIETVKTEQQISIVISALEPGFLSLIKDLNGNHVVQRCLECFSAEDSKFIFVSATKYCVDIAIHQHGCCVLQSCISHSTGELRENLISEISANGLVLAQDAFGNYVVQFILELKIPSITAKLTYQFEGHYVNLSRQKFSSHVVERCLTTGNNEVKSKIIHELLSTPYFDQLLQDPHANYVVQTALKKTEGPLHNSLVDAIESYKVLSRSSPYSKKIFSHKVLKR